MQAKGLIHKCSIARNAPLFLTCFLSTTITSFSNLAQVNVDTSRTALAIMREPRVGE